LTGGIVVVVVGATVVVVVERVVLGARGNVLSSARAAVPEAC
jgi:hypothetical protein